MRVVIVIASVVLLSGCDAAQRTIQSATGTDPATRCASAQTYRALNQILYDRIWPGFPGSKRPSFRSVAEVADRVGYARPVLDRVDPTSNVAHCSADLVVHDALKMLPSEIDLGVRVRAEGDALVTPIKYDVAQTADTRSVIVRLDQDAEIATFVRTVGSMTQSQALRMLGESERRQQAELDAEDREANATTAAPVIDEQEAPIDTRDEQLGENHL